MGLVPKAAMFGKTCERLVLGYAEPLRQSSTVLIHSRGGIDARPHRQDRGNLLHRTAGPYIWVISPRT